MPQPKKQNPKTPLSYWFYISSNNLLQLANLKLNLWYINNFQSFLRGSRRYFILLSFLCSCFFRFSSYLFFSLYLFLLKSFPLNLLESFSFLLLCNNIEISRLFNCLAYCWLLQVDASCGRPDFIGDLEREQTYCIKTIHIHWKPTWWSAIRCS